MKMTFTYSDDLISDFHKEVYGYRPRETFWNEWEKCTPSEKQKTWDEYARVSELQAIETKAKEASDVQVFEDRINDVIEIGAGDRKTALRWITDQETFYHGQDVEHFVWEKGILFTDYGKSLLEELYALVKYKEYA
tara:strand:- start:1694 stop:2101 length:408 start_codon:yes stop_codon:yes gene_type:complete